MRQGTLSAYDLADKVDTSSRRILLVSTYMEETHDPGQGGHSSSSTTWWRSDIIEKFGSISLASQDEILSQRESSSNTEENELSSHSESEILWSTGILSKPITDGFYSVNPDRKA